MMTGEDVKRQVEETHAAVGEALTITRGGTVQMPKAHWDRIIAAGLNLKPALAPCVLLTREEADSLLALDLEINACLNDDRAWEGEELVALLERVADALALLSSDEAGDE